MAEVDVLVVGGGPSGMTVAAEIARTGASVRILEKRAVAPIPRAGTVLPRPLELFDARGIADRFIKRTAEMNPHPFQTWHIWAGMHPVDWTDRDSRFGFTLFLSQHESETILRDWALETGVEMTFEAEVENVDDVGDGVEVGWRASDGQQHTTTATYVVGADGGRSRVREAIGIARIGHPSTFTGIIANADIDFPWAGGMKVGQNTHGWVAAYPYGPGVTRFTMVHAEGRKAAQNEPVTAEEVAKQAGEILGEHVEVPSLSAASRYGDAQFRAEAFRKGRVFLVGEAARVHYPASGVGMNYCIQDAFNLGWKIGAVLAGQADEALLDTYESERRPIVEDLLRSVDSQVAVQFNFTEEGMAFKERFEKHMITTPYVTAQLWKELNGLESAYPSPQGSHAAVGWPAPDFDLFLRDGSSVRLYELLRRSPFVIVDLSGTGMLRGFDVEGLPATFVEAHAARRPQSLRGITALVVRPDTYVAWAGEGSNVDAADVRTALRDFLSPA
ncbi:MULTISPECIES: FAD-dependent monooxygenase [unclassified Rhodococcus (in: high G+C Gram-positive bacteria)]|uniref:FAD-dependent monooxygenase n=1 Tax=unclassified Rhodococcus (in: high G+C Gram-positive bacteria) TaxID=192944 RepID=UPI00092BBFF5|nr:FAD-dependent monooxygenase [Rhodococcus sp. M8]OLL20925.1 2-polyprenyl-6-methoxyphenol hydroxylase-like oxidoreductase [Rhodococcus sp. M8]QPG44772.1 FAD-dependent monooxygenase [Rhodococcus sp. M8]